MTSAIFLEQPSGLHKFYGEESARIEQEFVSRGDGRSMVAGRAALLDRIIGQLWERLSTQHGEGLDGLALVAVGGYGRKCLFPFSDVDLLFLFADSAAEKRYVDQVRGLSQEMWDLGIRFSPASRVLGECDRFDPNNLEFTISLLDSRFLAGSRELFGRLHDKLIPKVVMRDAQLVIQRLAELTRGRHGKHGNTVFHLEPNIKDAPGGLRDYNVAHWLALIAAIDKLHDWPAGNDLLPASMRKPVEAAHDFLMAVRCFLHFRHRRDDNSLSWTDQDAAAAQKIGAADTGVEKPAEWMRLYFRHARSVHRICVQLLDEALASSSSLYRQFESWRSRISNADFSVVHGFIFLQQPSSLQDPEVLLRLFHFMAHHGLKLSTTTEQKVELVLPTMAATPPRGAELWIYLQEILLQPHAADALRAMHALRFLTLVLPELKGIDALVVRDYYHRFTVDEHSFLAIESLHRLRQSASEWDVRYTELLGELEQPELLYLSLLLHDVGKSAQEGEHIPASLDIAERCLERLDLAPEERETVRFLIKNHLEMSACLRRDIFDAGTVHAFAEKIQSPERLKMLCLMTYADIKAVNPEALTPWKAENLWQLYIETANYMNLSADQRVHLDTEEENQLVRTLFPVAGKRLKPFLEGLPRRYLATYSAKEVLAHLELAGRLKSEPVQVALERGRHWYDLTLVTLDRPLVFARVTGVLAAWGMSIVKASAFSNAAGTVVDTFHFTDRFRTLELNLPEWERFKRSIVAVLLGESDLEKMLHDRARAGPAGSAKTRVQTRIDFHDAPTSPSTVLQVIAQDRPGLLYRISSRLAYQKCNIEIALIDTEGEMAIDVFYLTSQGTKIGADHQERVRKALVEELGRD
jgi:[protein-PII] uridylyltransferase